MKQNLGTWEWERRDGRAQRKYWVWLCALRCTEREHIVLSCTQHTISLVELPSLSPTYPTGHILYIHVDIFPMPWPLNKEGMGGSSESPCPPQPHPAPPHPQKNPTPEIHHIFAFHHLEETESFQFSGVVFSFEAEPFNYLSFSTDLSSEERCLPTVEWMEGIDWPNNKISRG